MTLPLLICNIVPLCMTEGVAVIRFLVVLLTATVLGCGSSGDQNDPDAQAQRDTVDATSDLPDLNSNDQDTTGERDFTPQDLDSSQDDTKPEIICNCKNNDDCATAFADLDQCERAICNPNSCSCERAPKLDNFPCDDGDACTFGDKCIDGACKPGENQCECTTNDDCAGLEDGNLCNGTLICDSSVIPTVCVVDPATIIDCGQNLPGACMGFVCDPQTGECVPDQPINEGLECDDLDACTENDTCVNGECVAEEVDCDDGLVCTTDECNPEIGCVYTYNEEPCDDGNPNTIGDKCKDGVCVPGEELPPSD